MKTQSNTLLETLKAFALVAAVGGVVAGIFNLLASSGYQLSAPAISAPGTASTADRPVWFEIDSQRRVRATLHPRPSMSSFKAELPELDLSTRVDSLDKVHKSPGDQMIGRSDLYAARFDVTPRDPYASELPRWICNSVPVANLDDGCGILGDRSPVSGRSAGDAVHWKIPSVLFSDGRPTVVVGTAPAARLANAPMSACGIVLTDHSFQSAPAEHSRAGALGDQITTTDVELDRQWEQMPSGPGTGDTSRVAGMRCIDGKEAYA